MSADPERAFLEAACVPRDRAHVSGTLEEPLAILDAHPEVASASVHTAAVLGDADAVRRFVEGDPDLATAKGGPHGWDALTHLCFSRWLRLDPDRSEGFVRAAEALLDAGADPNTGWWEEHHEPHPEWEPVLYGAAGVAHHPELTRLLLERGADPNASEVVYHAPETHDNRVLKHLLGTGRLTGESLSLMLIRKLDWHDPEGVRLLLVGGADPARGRFRGWLPLHHAIARGNRAEIVEALLERGADPEALQDGVSAVALAARRGRGDLLELFDARGVPTGMDGLDALVATCARGDREGAAAAVDEEPDLLEALLGHGGVLLGAFAGAGNTAGVAALLDLGVGVDTLCPGEPYWGVARGSMALHVAAWRARHETVAALVARGAPLDALDGAGRTPLALAVAAGVDSYWADRRAPDSVRVLLDAGASVAGVPWPSGWDEADDLLREHGAGP